MELPLSETIKSNKLSSIFKNTTASYKFIWFLSILDFVEKGKIDISKKDFFSNGSKAWYSITFYNLSFGKSDILASTILSIKNTFQILSTLELNELEKTISTKVNPNEVLFLNKNVPYRFLSPWYGSISELEIEELSQ